MGNTIRAGKGRPEPGFSYDQLMTRNQAKPGVFRPWDESLEDTANLPEPDVLAAEMLEDFEAAVGLLREIVEDLGE